MDCRLYQKGLVLLVAWFSLTAQAQEKPVNWRDSLAVLNAQIVRETTWDTDLHLRKAAANLELHQWQYAIDEYGLILQHQVQNPAALFYRGYAATHLRRYEAARADYEELLGIFPTHTEARLSLAYVLEQMGRDIEALDQLNMLVEMRPDSAMMYASRASLEHKLKQYDAALYDWDMAIRLDPQNADYVASEVELLLYVERKDEARRVLDAAVQRGIPRGLLHSWYDRVRKAKKPKMNAIDLKKR